MKELAWLTVLLGIGIAIGIGIGTARAPSQRWVPPAEDCWPGTRKDGMKMLVCEIHDAEVRF